jgi:F-type H+-transporting ATPase subunit delta
VTLHAVARRYASALFDVSEQKKSTDAVQAGLTALAATVAGSPELTQVFASPAVPAAKKTAVAAELVSRLSAPDEVARLVASLGERDRLSLVAEVAAAFDARVREARHVMQADVTTAVPLSDAHKAQLAAALGQATGGTVTINAHVDPAIVGGVVARVGSLVFDGSVTRQLERMKTVLTQDN